MSVTKDWKPMQSEGKETIEDILKLPIVAIPERKIKKDTCEHFGIRCALSPNDGKSIQAIYAPITKEKRLVAFQKKDLTKPKGDKGHFTFIGNVDSSCDLFGQNVAPTGGKKSFCTEGVLDAAAAWQVLKENSKSSNNPACVAVLSTSWAAKQVAHQKAFYDNFQENIFALDQDQCTPEELKKGMIKGKEATQCIAQLMPNILVASFSEKDANDMIKQGKDEELYWALISKAKAYKPDGFVNVDDIFDEATAMPTWGRPWPWPSLTKLTYGRRDGEGAYFGAGRHTCSGAW